MWPFFDATKRVGRETQDQCRFGTTNPKVKTNFLVIHQSTLFLLKKQLQFLAEHSPSKFEYIYIAWGKHRSTLMSVSFIWIYILHRSPKIQILRNCWDGSPKRIRHRNLTEISRNSHILKGDACSKPSLLVSMLNLL